MDRVLTWHELKTIRELTPNPFKRQPYKMVKHTKTICRQIADEMFECVLPCCGVGA